MSRLLPTAPRCLSIRLCIEVCHIHSHCDLRLLYGKDYGCAPGVIRRCGLRVDVHRTVFFGYQARRFFEPDGGAIYACSCPVDLPQLSLYLADSPGHDILGQLARGIHLRFYDACPCCGDSSPGDIWRKAAVKLELTSSKSLLPGTTLPAVWHTMAAGAAP